MKTTKPTGKKRKPKLLDLVILLNQLIEKKTARNVLFFC
jgi:hypothetical protein